MARYEISNEVARYSAEFVGDHVLELRIDDAVRAYARWTIEEGFDRLPSIFFDVGRQLESMIRADRMGPLELIECPQATEHEKRDASLTILAAHAHAVMVGRFRIYDDREICRVLRYLETPYSR